MTADLALRDAILALRDAGVEDAPRDARLLLARAMAVPADRLTLHLQDPLSPEARAAFDALIRRRCAREPVSQVLGERLFWGRAFTVTRDTLDPRPETEILVAEALKQPFFNMLDLGTGTGCILISCLLDMPAAQGLGVDLSEAALAVARSNAARHHLTRAKFTRSDWFSAVTGRYDLIVSNPPYIAAEEMPGLAPEVRNWEPALALSPGGDGLDAYRAIALGAPARLMAGGRLLLEIGPTQGAAVSALLAAQGLEDIRILKDFDGRDRVVAASKPTRESDPVAT